GVDLVAPPRVSIVIVSFNARADLERCLGSLRDAPPQLTHDITVVDNASTDASADAARAAGANAIENNANVGFARANNIGIRASAGAYILLLTRDTPVPAGAIDRLAAELDRDEQVAVVGPRLVDGSGRAELSHGRMIGPLNELLQQCRARGDVEMRSRQRQYPDW